MARTYLFSELILTSMLYERQNLQYGEDQMEVAHEGWEGSDETIEIFQRDVPNFRNPMGAQYCQSPQFA